MILKLSFTVSICILSFVFYHNFPLACVQTIFCLASIIGPFGVDEIHTNF